MNGKFQMLRCSCLVFLVMLNACSGGGVNISVEGPTIPPFPPIPQPQSSEAITSYGPIAGLGGVTVNNVHYLTDSVTVVINGRPGNLSDLKLGYVATVNGRINSDGQSGTANSIVFDANLTGPVSFLDAVSGRLTVMGQTVVSSAETLFGAGIDPFSFDGLSAGSIVQISGYVDAAGTIGATRIDRVPANTETHIIGTVGGLDLANLLFTINGLIVDYSSAVVIGLPDSMPSNSMRIKAVGTMSSGLFIADRLESISRPAGNTGQRIQAAGVITRFNSPADFDLNGSPVTVTAVTVFLNGDAGDLGLNAEVVIDGAFDSNGRITANYVTLGRLPIETAILVFDFDNFTEISVSTVFNLTVTQGSTFSVEVAVDVDVQDRVDVTQAGSRLNIALYPGNGNIETLHAFVTMPALNGIDLSGVVNAALHGFSQTQMTVDIDGVSRLEGSESMIDHLTANVSGVSQLDLGSIRPIGNANINVSGVSQATLNMDVGASMAGSVGTGQGTGVSTLFYYGTNVDVDVTTDALSLIVNLGATKP